MARSMGLNPAASMQGMMKEGHSHMEGLEGAVLRNIDASKQLSSIISTSLGPNGMNKLVVTHLEKIVVTSDCATIVKELEIEHPAAKMLQLAAEMQNDECGDGTNLTVSFAGELLTLTEDLLRSGLHTSEIIFGYKRASEKLFEVLPTLSHRSMAKATEKASLEEVVTPVLAAKQYGSEDVLAPLVAEACLGVMTSGNAVPPEAVRVAKILGGGVDQSRVIHGYVALRGAETSVDNVQNAKITVFGCGIEASTTEASSTVLMKDANDLKEYNKSEERKMEEIIKSIADSGSNVVVTGGSVSEMALHFLERYHLMCLKIASKWELRRLCSAVNATALVRLGPATPDEMGSCDSVAVKEVGGKHVTVFTSGGQSRLATILLRASTSSLLQDLERAVDDGVHAAKMACRDPRLVPGAGATEMQLSVQMHAFADASPGLDQYAIRAFAKALEFVPRTLATNAGLDAADVLAKLRAAHTNGNTMAGVNINAENSNDEVIDTKVVDILATKSSAFRLGIDAALTVLKVDQIIMAKPSGARKPAQ